MVKSQITESSVYHLQHQFLYQLPHHLRHQLQHQLQQLLQRQLTDMVETCKYTCNSNQTQLLRLYKLTIQMKLKC